MMETYVFVDVIVYKIYSMYWWNS